MECGDWFDAGQNCDPGWSNTVHLSHVCGVDLPANSSLNAMPLCCAQPLTAHPLDVQTELPPAARVCAARGNVTSNRSHARQVSPQLTSNTIIKPLQMHLKSNSAASRRARTTPAARVPPAPLSARPTTATGACTTAANSLQARVRRISAAFQLAIRSTRAQILVLLATRYLTTHPVGGEIKYYS